MMSSSQWHKFYGAEVAAPPELLFELLSDLPNYPQWLPESESYSGTTDVEPYPVQLATRYHDGRPGEPGKDWWGTVVGFQRPGSIDFHHTIHVAQLRATVDVHIHYALETEDDVTRVDRWIVMDIDMPRILRPLRAILISKFNQENERTMAALKRHAETRSPDPVGQA